MEIRIVQTRNWLPNQNWTVYAFRSFGRCRTISGQQVERKWGELRLSGYSFDLSCSTVPKTAHLYQWHQSRRDNNDRIIPLGSFYLFVMMAVIIAVVWCTPHYTIPSKITAVVEVAPHDTAQHTSSAHLIDGEGESQKKKREELW